MCKCSFIVEEIIPSYPIIEIQRSQRGNGDAEPDRESNDPGSIPDYQISPEYIYGR